jgi:hypothetical protein
MDVLHVRESANAIAEPAGRNYNAKINYLLDVIFRQGLPVC